ISDQNEYVIDIEQTKRDQLNKIKVRDLFRSKHSTIPKKFRGKAAYYLYIFHAIEYIFISLYIDWTVILRHPINFLKIITFLTISAVFLFIYGLIPSLREKEIKDIMKKWTIELSNQKIAAEDNNLRNEIKSGIIVLGQSEIDKNDDDDVRKLRKLKALLFLSSLVYVRNGQDISKIHDCVHEIKKNYKETSSLNKRKKILEHALDKLNEIIREANGDGERATEIGFEEVERLISIIINRNDEFIKNQVKNLELGDLEFTSVSELNTDDGGSFCGIFWSKEKNFIVVVFKGTTPSNIGEWMKNLMFQCVDARVHLLGQVHRGFYEYLFAESEADRDFP
ncbi:17561_t:CDS:2, partial [Acaulospora morrowiae]